jgi:hypothetical protein
MENTPILTRLFMNRETWETIKNSPGISQAKVFDNFPESLGWDSVPVEIDDTLEYGMIESEITAMPSSGELIKFWEEKML